MELLERFQANVCSLTQEAFGAADAIRSNV